MDLQVGNQDMVGTFSVFEEGQLLGFDWIFWNRTTYHHKAMGAFPSVRLVSKFSHFPAVAQFFEATPSGLGFDGGVFLGHNHIAAAYRIEELDDSSSEESGVGPDADTGSGNLLGDLGQAAFEERDRAGAAGGIAGPQRSVPELLQMGLETQKRVIRASPFFLGVVAHPGELKFSIDREHDGI